MARIRFSELGPPSLFVNMLWVAQVCSIRLTRCSRTTAAWRNKSQRTYNLPSSSNYVLQLQLTPKGMHRMQLTPKSMRRV